MQCMSYRLLADRALTFLNRIQIGMEKKMLDMYKDSKRSELRFVKNRWKSNRQTSRALKRKIKSSWKQEKVTRKSSIRGLIEHV